MQVDPVGIGQCAGAVYAARHLVVHFQCGGRLPDSLSSSRQRGFQATRAWQKKEYDMVNLYP